MDILQNAYRGQGLATNVMSDAPVPSVDAAAPMGLLAQCPAAAETALVRADGLAALMGVAAVHIKDERTRMGLGSFKALGAAYVIAHEAAATGEKDLRQALKGRCYVTASAGNHGLSVAAGARIFGARAVIYLSETVPEGFADRLRAKGAEVVRSGEVYEDSMNGAAMAAENHGWTLLSDSSWPGYFDLPHRLMEGYLVLAAETVLAMPAPPTHIFLQAGVGGLAGACAAYFRKAWGDAPQIVVVEPQAAPALHASIVAGKPALGDGPVSIMGRLDCKEPSLIALAGLSRDADAFALISEEEGAEVLPHLAENGLQTSASGGAGVAAAMLSGLGPEAHVLCIVSEEPA